MLFVQDQVCLSASKFTVLDRSVRLIWCVVNFVQGGKIAMYTYIPVFGHFRTEILMVANSLFGALYVATKK